LEKYTRGKNANLKYCKISTLLDHKIKMQRKYSVLRYLISASSRLLFRPVLKTYLFGKYYGSWTFLTH